jgi:hypothetical protein
LKQVNGVAFDIVMTSHDPVAFEVAAREETLTDCTGPGLNTQKMIMPGTDSCCSQSITG